MKLILHYIRRHLNLFLTAITFLTIEAIADLLQPAIMERIVDKGVKEANISQILTYGGVMICIAAIGAFGAIMRNIYASRTSQTVSRELRSDLYKKVQTLSLENIDHLQPAAIITRITNDVTQIQDFVNGCMRIMAKAPITCIGAMVLLALQTPWQIPVMTAILLIAAVLIFANIRLGYPRFGFMQQKLDRLNKVSREFLSSIRVVKAFQAEAIEMEKFKEASQGLATATTSAMQIMAVFSPLINLTVNLGIVLLLWLSRNQNSQIGHLMASVNYMTQILFSLGMVSNILNTAARATASSQRLNEILQAIPSQIMVQNEISTVREGDIRFENVSFTYSGASQETLHHITFQAAPGTTIGIIGPTGSGKSTLVNLIPRFYDATYGTIQVDGIDVKQISPKDLRTAVAIVPQKALLFSGTILENLRWGSQDASQAEIEASARIACAHDFILDTPKGYHTVLGQGGVNLSGGQKQRLALARALVRHPKILILDDCTSALDAATESKVLSGLRAMNGITVFLISQRISAVRQADKILCLENGKIQGFGTHAELMSRCSTYQAIYASQIGGDDNG